MGDTGVFAVRRSRFVVLMAFVAVVAATLGLWVGLALSSRAVAEKVEAAVSPRGALERMGGNLATQLVAGLISREIVESVLRNGVMPLAGKVVAAPPDPTHQAEVEINEVYTTNRQVTAGGQTLKPGARIRALILDLSGDGEGPKAGDQVLALVLFHPTGDATVVGANAAILMEFVQLPR